MELEFTPDQEELRETVRTVLARECTPSLVRAVYEDPTAAAGLWQQMVELGWPGLTVPEDAGGIGLGAIELAVVVEELGRALAPGPLFATVSQLAPVVGPELTGGPVQALADGMHETRGDLVDRRRLGEHPGDGKLGLETLLRLERLLLRAALAQHFLRFGRAGPEVGRPRLLSQPLERAPRGVGIKDSRGGRPAAPRRSAEKRSGRRVRSSAPRLPT